MTQFKNVLALLDRPIAYHRVFAEIGGSVTAGVFLSQAVYWSQRTKNDEGWFWKTQKEWYEETYLKRREQEAARRELRAIGVLEEKKKGAPAKLYFKINAETLVKRLLSPGCQDAPSLNAEMLHATTKHAQNAQSSEADGDQPRMADSYNLLNTETTPEISTEITNQDPLYPPRGDGSRTLDENFQNAKEGSPETELASFSNGSTHTREAKHNRKGSSRRAAAKKFPEQFDQWWMQYRQFCISTDKEAGDRAAAVKTWDLLIELEPEADIGRQVLEGSQWYAACKFQEYTAKGEAIGVPHGCRFLSKRKWAEALEHKAAKPDYLAKAKSLSCDADALWKQVFFAISGGDCEVPPIAKQAIASFGSMRELGNQSPEWIERVLKPKFFKEIQNAATSTP
jgi:hypothetical protein